MKKLARAQLKARAAQAVAAILAKKANDKAAKIAKAAKASKTDTTISLLPHRKLQYMAIPAIVLLIDKSQTSMKTPATWSDLNFYAKSGAYKNVTVGLLAPCAWAELGNSACVKVLRSPALSY